MREVRFKPRINDDKGKQQTLIRILTTNAVYAEIF